MTVHLAIRTCPRGSNLCKEKYDNIVIWNREKVINKQLVSDFLNLWVIFMKQSLFHI